jgi:hypothetical protein
MFKRFSAKGEALNHFKLLLFVFIAVCIVVNSAKKNDLSTLQYQLVSDVLYNQDNRIRAKIFECVNLIFLFCLFDLIFSN